MAGVIQRFEQRLEGAVTGAFARAFRSAVQPVEIAAALQREVDNSTHVLSRDRMLAPNVFVVELSESDHERLAQFSGTLAEELSPPRRRARRRAAVHPHRSARHHLRRGTDLGTGRFRVRSSASASVTPVAGQRMTETAIRASDVVIEVNGMRHPLRRPASSSAAAVRPTCASTTRASPDSMHRSRSIGDRGRQVVTVATSAPPTASSSTAIASTQAQRPRRVAHPAGQHRHRHPDQRVRSRPQSDGPNV